jgi:hypothetical protein
MSHYGVNAGVPKSLVRHLVSWYAETTGSQKVAAALRDILDTPISPELLPADQNGKIAQKTEDVVGPYELHDFFLFHVLRNGFTPKKILKLATIAFDGVVRAGRNTQMARDVLQTLLLAAIQAFVPAGRREDRLRLPVSTRRLAHAQRRRRVDVACRPEGSGRGAPGRRRLKFKGITGGLPAAR